MERQNVTIALAPDLLRDARHLVVDRGLSLSKFIALLVENQVEASQRYKAARERQRQLLRAGLNLGTGGQITWNRDQLHER
ncbi:MAG TPA: CopG family transcriptional regulator [Chloroflexota bacterium]|nr:CopG family transcriptional regulator [Chloroflexota bacterium]